MREVVIIAQIVAIFLLLVELIYISYQRPSQSRVRLFIVVASTLVMLVGYLMEIFATNVESAMFSVYFAYLGKPFALFGSLLFVAEYCGKPIPKGWSIFLAIYHGAFSVIVFTNPIHALFYSSVDFELSQTFSGLILGHGPLYYAYMVTVCAHLVANLVLVVHEYRANTSSVARRQVLYLFSILACSVLGYMMFLFGLTSGYDATMAGAFVGAIILGVLFIRFRLFDYLSLAKDKALEDAANGLIVMNQRGQIVYFNTMADDLMESGFNQVSVQALPVGSSQIHWGEKVYEVCKSMVEDRGRSFGQTVEFTDVTDRFNYSARLERDVENRTREIRRIQRSVVSSFAGIVEARDNSTGMHIKRVSRYTELVAEGLLELGHYTEQLGEEDIALMVDAAPLHDIGKLSIPDRILLKPGRLTEDEFEVIKTHAEQGARIVEECLRGVERDNYVAVAKNVALSHHEKWNGTGYPDGLAGTDIPLAARIVAVADVYDAIRSERCYKPPMEPEEARQVIADGRGTHFDPAVADAFLLMFDKIEAERNRLPD